jgi:hypothetical protein
MAPARVLAISAFVYVLTLLVPPFLPSHAPDPGGDPEAFRSFLLEDYWMQHTQAFLHVVGALALVVFAWALTAHLDRDARSKLGALAWAGALGAAMVVFVGMGLTASAIFGVDLFPASTVEFAFNAGWFLFLRSVAFLALFLVPVGLLVLQGNRLPPAFAWSAFGVAGVLAVGSFVLVSPVLFGVAGLGHMLFGLWVASVGVAVLMRERGPPHRRR